MDSVYIAYTFIVAPKEPDTEILMAELGFADFESFIENENGVVAYIQEKDWNEDILDDIQILNSNEFALHMKKKLSNKPTGIKNGRRILILFR